MKPEITKIPQSAITYDGEELESYRPPVLFPDIGKYQDPGQQRLYVLQRIEQIFDEDDLCVTDMLAQPSRIRNLCGRIIFGIDLNPDSLREERAQRDLRPDVLAHPVRIKCIGKNDTVKFKRAVITDPRQSVDLGGKLGVGTMDGSGSGISWSGRRVKKVDERIDFKTNEAVLVLKDAWICLSQLGEYCRPARSTRLRQRYWRYQELDENGNRMIDRHNEPEPAKRGPGRPPKK